MTYQKCFRLAAIFFIIGLSLSAILNSNKASAAEKAPDLIADISAPYLNYTLTKTAPNTYVLDLKEHLMLSYIPHYVGLSAALAKMTSADILVIRLHNSGGYINTMEKIIKDLKSSKAKKISRIEGDTASAASILACHADTIVQNPNVFLMFHEVRVSMMEAPISYVEKMISKTRDEMRSHLKECVNKNILTNEDVEKIVSGIDVYRYADGTKNENDRRGLAEHE